MDLQVTKDDGTVVLDARGEIDMHTADQLAAIGLLALRERATRRLVIDLSAVDFVDSVGLGVLVQLHQGAEQAGSALVLRHPQPQMSRILTVTDLGSVFTVEP